MKTNEEIRETAVRITKILQNEENFNIGDIARILEILTISAFRTMLQTQPPDIKVTHELIDTFCNLLQKEKNRKIGNGI